MATTALMLAGCAIVPPGLLGKETNPTPPPVTTIDGGVTGVLLSGNTAPPPPVPPALVDTVIGGDLIRWLAVPERPAVAAASQQAAVAERYVKIAWAAAEPNGEMRAKGWVMPVSDAYRSEHGLICRDVRQALEHGDEPVQQSVSLCRTDQGGGLWVWRIPQWPLV